MLMLRQTRLSDKRLDGIFTTPLSLVVYLGNVASNKKFIMPTET
jgi:hypothetical protein